MSNFEEILRKKLVLAQPLMKEAAAGLNLANTYFEREEEYYLPKQWFCSIDSGEWEGIEIFVQGNEKKPDEEYIKLAEKILAELSQHLNRAQNYLKEFFPAHNSEDYELTAISFGTFLSFDEHVFSGFTIDFIYGEYPYTFQYKVKFKEDGWPIGFEGAPL